jgi:hypothetical protein
MACFFHGLGDVCLVICLEWGEILARLQGSNILGLVLPRRDTSFCQNNFKAFHSNGLEGRVLKKSGDVCFTLEATSRGVAYYSPPSLVLSDRIRGGSYVLRTLPTCVNKHLLSVKGIIGSGSMVLAPINIGHQFEA